jgi:hypothetical protein
MKDDLENEFISVKYSDRKTMIQGFVIDSSDHWMLLKHCPGDFIMDGYIIVSSNNVEKLIQDELEKFKEKVIKLKRQQPTGKIKIPLTDLKAILSFLTDKYKVFQFQTKSETASYLGRLKSIDSKKLIIDFLDTNGQWGGEMSFRPGDVRVIEFDNDYINSLKLVPKKKTGKKKSTR